MIRAFVIDLAFVLAESRPAELAVKVLADASKASFEVAQDDIAFIPSSSAWSIKPRSLIILSIG